MEASSNISGIYDLDETAIRQAPAAMQRSRWPLAGLKLTTEICATWGIQADINTIKAVRIPHTHHDYTVVNGYLVPYYPPTKTTLNRRREERIIDRSRAWILNAMPQMNVTWDEKQIDERLGNFQSKLASVPPGDMQALGECAADFRLIFGAIMSRFEMLGRAIAQGDTVGTTIVPQMDTSRDTEMPILPFALQPKDAPSTIDPNLTAEQMKALEAEYRRYFMLLNKQEMLPLLRLVLLTDMKIDRDGVLIDYLREVGKPIRVQQESQARHQDELIISKIGDAIESIDQLYATLRQALTKGNTGKVFEAAAQDFIAKRGSEYGVHSTADIFAKLDDYAALCRARAGIKTDDAVGFSEIYSKLSSLEQFFNGENGLLQSMKRASRGQSREVADLRQLTTRGLKLMVRTAYTRIPSNARAPEVWVPNFDNGAPPLESYLAQQFLSTAEKQEAKKVIDAADGLPASERQRFLQREFCSLGCLTRDFRTLEQNLSKQETRDIRPGGRERQPPRKGGIEPQNAPTRSGGIGS